MEMLQIVSEKQNLESPTAHSFTLSRHRVSRSAVWLPPLFPPALTAPPTPALAAATRAPLRNDDVDILMINSCLVELGHVSGHIFIDSF